MVKVPADPSLLEQQAGLTRLALASMRQILSLPLPPPDDLSMGAQEARDFQLQVAQSVLANARRAKEQLARTGGITALSEALREIATLGTVH